MIMSVSNIFYDSPTYTGIETGYGGGTGAAVPMKVTLTSGKEVNIEPVQEASLGYVLGNLFRKFITTSFQSVVNYMPSFFKIQGASASEIPHVEKVNKVVECHLAEVGNCDILETHVTGISVKNKEAYLANGGNLATVNVQNPSNPYPQAYWGYRRWSASGPPGILNKQTQACVGYFRHGLQMINIQDPSNLYLTGYYNASIGELEGMKVLEDKVYTTASFVEGGVFTIFNATNPSNPSVEGIYKFPHSFNWISQFDVTPQHAYVGSANGFFILSITNPKKPTLLVHYGEDPIIDVKVVGKTAFLLENRRLHSVDVSDPENPSSDDSIDISIPDGFSIFSNYAFVIGRDKEYNSRINIVNILNPYNLTLAGSFQFPDNRTIHGIDVSGGFVYVGGDKSFSVLKINCSDSYWSTK